MPYDHKILAEMSRVTTAGGTLPIFTNPSSTTSYIRQIWLHVGNRRLSLVAHRQWWEAAIPGSSVLLLSPSQMLHRLAHVVKDRNGHDGLASSERVAAAPV